MIALKSSNGKIMALNIINNPYFKVIMKDFLRIDASTTDCYNTINKISLPLAYETTKYLDYYDVQIRAIQGVIPSKEINHNIRLIIHSKSGLAMQDSFIKTLLPTGINYYSFKNNQCICNSLPSSMEFDKIVILDPIMCDASSNLALLEMLLHNGVRENQILLVSIISEQIAAEEIYNKYPSLVQIIGLCTDNFISSHNPDVYYDWVADYIFKDHNLISNTKYKYSEKVFSSWC